MIDKLKPNERDLLERLGKKVELRPLFFRRVSGLKWFRPLDEAGYFDSSNLPKPTPAKKEGYITIPYWPVLSYLQKCAKEITNETDDYFGKRISEIVTGSTNLAKAEDFGNYHAWRAFAEILHLLPSKFLTSDSVTAIDYWLNDKYETSLVSGEIGRSLLPKLLNEEASTSHEIALQICGVLFDPIFVTESRGGKEHTNAKLRFDVHDAEKLTGEIATTLGRILGLRGVALFETKLVETLCKLENDSWSSIWQPAIEDHEQNRHRDEAENILVRGYRDAIGSFVDTNPSAAAAYLDSTLDSKYGTLVRVAIQAIGAHFEFFIDRLGRLQNERFFGVNYHHEMWHFLSQRYGMLAAEQQQGFLAVIRDLKILDDNGNPRDAPTAFQQARWLAAIKDFGDEEFGLYQDAVAKSGTEPEHPDFLSYTSTDWVVEVSPYETDEIQSWSVPELIKKLTEFVPSQGWNEPGRKGLSASLKKAIKAHPLKYSDELNEFLGLDLAYVYNIIDAYRELWEEKKPLPWSDVWSSLFGFILPLIREDSFWSDANAKARDEFVANRHWVVGTLARLIEAGCKSDNHAFPEEYNNLAEEVLTILLSRELGERFSTDSDSVLIAINSPRGKCLEALINLTLRACRLENNANAGSHDRAWEHFRSYYEAELDRSLLNEYEFATLITMYLPNFLYMSREWVINNLPRIFEQENYLRWLCAMQGYSYVGTVYQEIYTFLREHGDLLKALDDSNLKQKIEDRVVQQIVVAYINDFESLEKENSLLKNLIDRRDCEELKQLVWFFWTLQKDDDTTLKQKAMSLWPILLDSADTHTAAGRQLVSSLADWTVFVDEINETSAPLLRAVAPFSDEDHNSYQMLKSLARLSDKQPLEVNAIWQELLTGSTPDYPEDAVRQILSNLVNIGREGVREAKDTVSKYLSHGVERPAKVLDELTETH